MGVWGDRCFGGIDDLIWDFYKLKSTCLWGGLDLIGNFMISSHLILRKYLTWLGILWFQVISSCGNAWLDWKFYDFKSSHLRGGLDLIGNFVISSHLILRKYLTWLGILWFQVISSCGSTWLDWEFYDFKSSHLAEMLDLICVFVIWSHPSFGEGLTWFAFL